MNYAKLPLAVFVAFAAFVVVSGVSSTDVAANAFKFTVFGYLPEYRLRGFDYKASFDTGLTHLIYFSLEVDGATFLPKAKDRLPTLFEARKARIAADATGGKLLLSFGGNARSHGFAEMVATSESRRTFLVALEELLQRYQFDGVDYNWEYPRNAKEWSNWALLLRESKDFLKGGDRSKNVVTFTMYLDPHHADVIQQFNMLEHADFVHCMAYDQHGKHSTYEFAVSGVRMAVEKKLPLEKFTLGVPFYARNIHNGEPKTYGDILPELKAKKPEHALSVDQLGTFYFNSQKMIERKTELAIASKLGGVMIWELGQDVQPESRPESLMHGILAALDKRFPGKYGAKQQSKSAADHQEL